MTWRDHAVTAFVIVTALINLALGYGLAVYLGHARRPTSSHAGDELSVALGYELPAAALPAADLSSPADETSPASLNVPVAAAPVDEPVELEQEVLAGIEEFRNQLAQMKGQPFPGDAAGVPAASQA
jgi:hypothetical protein